MARVAVRKVTALTQNFKVQTIDFQEQMCYNSLERFLPDESGHGPLPIGLVGEVVLLLSLVPVFVSMPENRELAPNQVLHGSMGAELASFPFHVYSPREIIYHLQIVMRGRLMHADHVRNVPEIGFQTLFDRFLEYLALRLCTCCTIQKHENLAITFNIDAPGVERVLQKTLHHHRIELA